MKSTALEKIKTPLDTDEPENRSLLKDLQGNILKGHDRDNAALFFLQFIGDDVNEIRRQIAKSSKHVTSFEVQMQEYNLYHNHGIPGGTFCNFFLTAKGYKKLGLADENKLKDLGFKDAFIEGMAARNQLKDPDPTLTWDKQYLEEGRPRDVHAMVLIADDDINTLGQWVRTFIRDILVSAKGDVLARIASSEHASQLRDESGQPVENFGFRDGISNPLFLKSDEERILKYGGDSKYKSWFPLQTVLVPDPFAQEPNSFGSYFVYRKLEQHVQLFENVIRNMATDLGLDSTNPDHLERVRGLIVGRYRDGSPLTTATGATPYAANDPSLNYNNFNYLDDRGGSRCPFHAHIRKANPRGESNRKDERERVIVRRGMTYDTDRRRDIDLQKISLNRMPDSGVGLLFMCFQADIEAQFEFIQTKMSGDPDFPQQGTGVDPLASQDSSQTSSLSSGWPYEWDRPGKAWFPFPQCVTLRAGEYFFAPSRSFLEKIDQL